MEVAQLMRIVGVAINNALLCLYSGDPCRRCVSIEQLPSPDCSRTSTQIRLITSLQKTSSTPYHLHLLSVIPTSPSYLSAMDRFYVTQGPDYCASPMSFANVPELMPCAYDDASTDPSPSPPMVSLSPRAPIKPIAK